MEVAIFDIETGGLPAEELIKFTKTFEAFDPSSIKIGNLKDPEKINEKIEVERQKHALEKEAFYRNILEKAALDPKTGRVLAIGLMDHEGDSEILCGEEVDILEEFWSYSKHFLLKNKKMAGWNIKLFDLPFLLLRSWKNAVSVPTDIYLGEGRWHAGFVDLMRYWTCGQYKEFEKLDTAARFLGFEGKQQEAVTGQSFEKYWNGTEVERMLALSYLKNDLLQTRKIAERIFGMEGLDVRNPFLLGKEAVPETSVRKTDIRMTDSNGINHSESLLFGKGMGKPILDDQNGFSQKRLQETCA